MLTTILVWGLISLVIYYFVRLVVIPYKNILFYRKHGAHTEYLPIIGSLLHDILAYKKTNDFLYSMKQMAKREPKPRVFGTNIMGTVYLKLIDPNLVKEFFVKQDAYLPNKDLFLLQEDVIGQGLLLSPPDQGKKFRKLASQAFHFDLLTSSIPEMIRITKEMIENIKKSDMKRVNILDSIQDMTSEIICRIFFGDQFNQYRIKGQKVTTLLAGLMKRIAGEFIAPLSILFGRSFPRRKLIKRHEELMNDIHAFRDFSENFVKSKFAEIEKNHKEGQPLRKNNLLEIFYEQRVKNPEDALTDREIVDLFAQFFLGGTDTSSSTINLGIWYALQNPDLKEKLLEEMEQVFGSKRPNKDAPFTHEDLKMNYTTAYIKETIRFAPPAPQLLDRLAVKDHYLGDFPIKKGTAVNIGIMTQCYDPDIVGDPDNFDPERWLNPNSKINQSIKENSFSFVPFSAGPRNCLGQNLAMFEVKIIMSLLLMNFDFKLSDPDYKLKLMISFVYGADDPIIYDMTPKITSSS